MNDALRLAGTALPVAYPFASALLLFYLFRKSIHLDQYESIRSTDNSDDLDNPVNNHDRNNNSTQSSAHASVVALSIKLARIGLTALQLGLAVFSFVHFYPGQTDNNNEQPSRLVISAPILPWSYALVLAFVFLLRPTTAYRFWIRLQLDLFYVLELVLMSLGIYYSGSLSRPVSEWVLEYKLQDAAWLTTALLVWVSLMTRPYQPPNLIKKQRGEIPVAASSESAASVYSLLTFAWVNSLVYLGYRRVLQESDLPNLETEDLSLTTSNQFTLVKRKSLSRSLFAALKKDALIQIMWSLPHSVFLIAAPLCSKNIIAYIECRECGPPTASNYLWVFALLATTLVASICLHASYRWARRLALKTTSIINTEVFKKSLHRKDIASSAEFKEDEDGNRKKDKSANISNLVAVDVKTIEGTIIQLDELYGLPLQAVLSSIGLYHLLGPAAVIGIGFMIVTMPLPAVLASVFMRLFNSIMESKDDRMDVLTEMLSGMRTVKYFGWETKFVEKITNAREKELKDNKKMYTQMSFASIAWSIMPLVNMVVLLVAYTVFYGHTITASVLFTTLSLFEILSSSLSTLPWTFISTMETVVALRRISTFLDEEDIERDTTVTKIDVKTRLSSSAPTARSASHPVIGFVRGTFSWPSKKVKSINTVKPAPKAGWFQNLKSKFSKAPTPAGQGNESSSIDAPASEPEAVIERFQLTNVSADFPVGELSLIVGPTGSGKSALLLALLGELERIEGHMYLPRLDYNNHSNDRGSGIAYVAQTAWLQNGTVRDNILFGKTFNQERYSAVLEGCALTTDLDVLEFGDRTEIGEQGIALSGGQKQRVSLARAIYSDASVLLLDDCLSAVDTHTGRHIFQTLNGPLLDRRTILMATHQVQLTLSAARYVVALDKGKVVGSGTPEDCIHQGWIDHVTLVASVSDQSSEVDTLDGDKSAKSDPKDDKKEASPVKPKDEETKAEGTVSLKVYKYYFFATGGWIAWVLLVGIYAVEQGARVANKSWLAIWANRMADTTGSLVLKAAHAVTPEPVLDSVKEAFAPSDGAAYGAFTMAVFGKGSPESVSVGFYIGVYVLLGLIPMLITCFSTYYAMVVLNINGSRSIHAQLLHKISRARSRFFDTTPVGRIINRFSADIATIDNGLIHSLMTLIFSAVMIVFTGIVISVNMPLFVVPASIIIGVYIVLAVLYVPVSRDLKRLNSVSRSPILNHFNETVNGLTTIRAYGFERRFQAKNLSNLDANNRAYYWLWSASRWLGWRLDLTSALVSFCTGLLILQRWGQIESGWAGLCLSYSTMFNTCVSWMIRSYAQNEMNMNSLERVIEYMNVEEEAPAVIEGSRPPASWPHAGQISIEHLTVKYSPDSPDVIKDLSLSIKGGEKVGVVGRTGSGKSTLAISLLRILEPTSGTIWIDDIDVSKIGLQDLRSNLTIIPQDPILFMGTLRFNLDPFGEREDIELWEALRRSHIIPATATRASGSNTPTLDSNLANKSKAPSTNDQETTTPLSEEAETTIDPSQITLDTEVHKGGSNFSQGQRQLIALARALVRQSKIIIMDEATASVDFETDLKIQATIREEMTDATIITIAHRIRTIADFDRVLVMQAGEVAEFDKPYTLMRQEGSLFRELCEQSTELDSLLTISEAKERRASA
ncbi:hypothetical protein K457DRAFT_31633 [Linnemannia elongata AG-77]|uniref:P-loop containing nucleoside triphosphate hydrolase protein n=1 Tax=Linnemannia elongata AG-77 TaxID=1314771 RepID=A0A197JZW4_9FUNG|nr:hypothetical protein K457DRAFT_31633 [Linnemannia elongata AG-77]